TRLAADRNLARVVRPAADQRASDRRGRRQHGDAPDGEPAAVRGDQELAAIVERHERTDADDLAARERQLADRGDARLELEHALRDPAREVALLEPRVSLSFSGRASAWV